MATVLNHDKRLDKLVDGQYRLWNDAQNILVPVGMSITKPLTPEIVNANAKVYGEIDKGYFKRPFVEFTNTNVDVEQFDGYYLQIFRDTIPQEPHVDPHEDLGLNEIHVKYHVNFKHKHIHGKMNGVTTFKWAAGKNWYSDILHFDTFGIEALQGDFVLVCNPTTAQQERGILYPTTEELHPTMAVDIIIKRALIRNGNSEMQLLVKNPLFIVELVNFELTILGGE